MLNKAILFIFILISYTIHSQDSQDNFSNGKSVHFSLIPTFYFNSVSLGLGLKNEKIENAVEINSILNLTGARWFSVGFHYTINYYLKNDKTFIPFWAGMKRSNIFDCNYEDGGPAYDKMSIRLGSGIGHNFKLKKSNNIRLELGVGAAIRFMNKKDYRNEITPFPFKLDLNKFSINETYPILPAFRLKIRYSFQFN